MKVRGSCQRIASWLLFIGLIFCISGNGYCQVISIEEFLETILPLQSVDTSFSYIPGEKILGYQYGDRYFSTRTSRDIDIFDTNGRIQYFPLNNSLFLVNAFIENKNLIFASAQQKGNNFIKGLFRFDGTPVKAYSNPDIYPSPGGKYFYTQCSMLDTYPISIYDYDGSSLFTVPVSHECQVMAPSDSQLIILHYKSLSLWDIKSKQKIWESNIPRDDYYTDSAYRITYSIERNIIAVRDAVGCYCFDFQGNFLWGKEGIGGNKFIKFVGVSKTDGNVVVAAVESNLIRANIFSRDGDLIEEITLDLGPNCSYAVSVNPGVAEVFPDFVIIGFKANIGPNKKIRVTGILYHADTTWMSAIIYGSWHILQSADNDFVLIGFDENDSKVSAFNFR